VLILLQKFELTTEGNEPNSDVTTKLYDLQIAARRCQARKAEIEVPIVQHAADFRQSFASHCTDFPGLDNVE